jgi:hypothetical protein
MTLKEIANELNLTSDNFNKIIVSLEEEIGIGITTWVRVAGQDDDEFHEFWSRELGYTKIDNKWGLAIRETTGNHISKVRERKIWAFNHAPRPYRIEALVMIPELLEKLKKFAIKTIKKLGESIDEAQIILDNFRKEIGEIN